MPAPILSEVISKFESAERVWKTHWSQSLDLESTNMHSEILGLIEELSESLVLWDSIDGSLLADKFEVIAIIADSLDQKEASQAAHKASLSLSKINMQGPNFSLTYLEETIAGLQDLFSNGRDPRQIAAFQSDYPKSQVVSVPSYIDAKILADFLSRQDSVMDDFEANILDLEKKFMQLPMEK